MPKDKPRLVPVYNLSSLTSAVYRRLKKKRHHRGKISQTSNALKERKKKGYAGQTEARVSPAKREFLLTEMGNWQSATRAKTSIFRQSGQYPLVRIIHRRLSLRDTTRDICRQTVKYECRGRQRRHFSGALAIRAFSHLLVRFPRDVFLRPRLIKSSVKLSPFPASKT